MKLFDRLFSKRPKALRSGEKPRERVRVLFAGHDLKFITPFIRHCQAESLYDVRLDEHPGHEIASEETSHECVQWADVVFCEWALGNAVWYSQHKRPGQRLIVRLHLQEWQARDQISYIYNVDWEKVDRLILICHYTYDKMVETFPILKSKACLIYNPIDAAGTLNRPKPENAAYNLGFVGMVPQRKRIDLAVETVRRLRERDSRFRLFVKGKRPEEYSWMLSRTDEMAWYERVYQQIHALDGEGAVIFDGWGDDMADWYAKIGFIMSTSDFEGSHQAVAEGMAVGCLPVIRHWEGADRIYPAKYVVDDPQTAAERIWEWVNSDRLEAEQDSCRRYAVAHFDQREVCARLESLFAPLPVGRIPAQDVAALHSARQALPTVMILGYVPAGYRGGYRIRIEQEIAAFVKLGCGVHFACLHSPADDDTLAQHRDALRQLGCQVHLIPSPRFFDIQMDPSSVAAELTALRRIVDQYGIDVVHAEALYSARVAILLKQAQPSIAVAFDAHGVTPEEERMGKAHERRIAEMEKWERRVLAEADLRVFVSAAMSEHYQAKYQWSPSQPHEFVPCCVGEPCFHDVASQGNFKEVPPDRPVVAYAGTMADWQCGPEMIRLFAQLHRHDPSLFFLLLVPGNDHPKVREWMADGGLSEQDVVLQEVPHGQVGGWLRQAHCGVLLRRDDPVNRVASPTKFGEYLAAGLPVVMTDCIGDFSVLADREQVGLVLQAGCLDEEVFPDSHIEQVAGFARSCMDRARQLRQRCRAVARDQLYWDVAAERLLRSLRTIACKAD